MKRFFLLIFCRYDQLPLEHKNPGEKEGALHLIGAIASLLIESPHFTTALEPIVKTYVVPELSSPIPFLRARVRLVFQFHF